MMFFIAKILARLGFSVPVRISSVPSSWNAIYEFGEYRNREQSDNDRSGLLYRHSHGVLVVDMGDSFIHSPESITV